MGLLLLALPSGSRAYVEVVMSPSLAPFSLSSSSPHTHTRLRGARTAQCAQREKRDRLLERARAAAADRPSPRPMGSLSDTFAAHSGFSPPSFGHGGSLCQCSENKVSDPAYMDNKARFYTFGTGHVYRQYTSNGFFAEHSRSACYLRYESRG